MPITGRSIAGAGLQGLGEGLQQWSAQTIKRKQIQDEWAFELYKQQLAQQAKREDAQTAGQQALIGNIMKDPASASAYIAAAQIDPAMKGMPIEPIQQLARTVAPRLISQQLLTAPTTEAMGADLGRRFTNATGQDYGSLPLQPALDMQAFGGEQPDRAIQPDLQSALSDALTRSAQLRAAEQDKIARAGETAQSTELGKKTGELTAGLNLAPQLTDAEVAKINAEAGPKAAAAGQSQLAQNMANVNPAFVAANASKISTDELAKLTPPIQAAKASEAGKITGAQEAAKSPYEKPTMLYDAEGGATPVHFGPQGATVVPGLPPGLRLQAPQKLTQGQVESKAIMNTAELNGVQILKSLHAAGLDRDNTPWNPRYTNFIAQQLKIAPDDFRQADINQRAAMVQATLLRTMTGARPSKEWMDMLAAHLPNPLMSGQQLAMVLNNVLQQQQQKRDDMAQSTGHSATWMAPTPTRPGELTYDQWLEAVKQERAGGAPAGTAPPGLQTAPAGTSAPTAGDDLIKKILQQPPR